MQKNKVLLIGTHDSKMAGHTQAIYEKIKNHTEAVMVTRFGFYGKASHCYWPLMGGGYTLAEKIKYFRFSRSFFIIWKYFYCFLRFGCIPVVDKKHPEYSFGDLDFLPYTAKDILKKCPKGFEPDLIRIGWCSRFISSKIIHDLYQQTKAKIVYSFLDEAPITGGCHYPNECKQYLNGCINCPALSHGKRFAAIQLRNKQKWLKNIPLYLSGSPYDMRLAESTKLFKDAITIPSISYRNVKITAKQEARKALGIQEDRFVVLIGSTQVETVRKGFIYTIDSINLASDKIDNFLVVVVGKTKDGFKLNFPNTEVLELGFVDTDKMILAYCAADCFLSTTIADSGPQMVNYSFATGTPVVSFFMGIAQDLVVHKKTGYIANFKDSVDLANGLLFIYSLNNEAKKQMSEDCVKIIKEKSSAGGWTKQLLGIS